MKKVLLNFAEGLLSREQMRGIKGGATSYATCIGATGNYEVRCGGTSCTSEDDSPGPGGTGGGGGYCSCNDENGTDYKSCHPS